MWVESAEEKAEWVVKTLKEFGVDVPELALDPFLDPVRVIRMGHLPLQIELLTSVAGVGVADCYSSRVVEEMDDGTPIHFIGLEE